MDHEEAFRDKVRRLDFVKRLFGFFVRILVGCYRFFGDARELNLTPVFINEKLNCFRINFLNFRAPFNVVIIDQVKRVNFLVMFCVFREAFSDGSAEY